MKKLGLALGLWLALLSPVGSQNAALLPPAQVQFFDANGQSLSGGSVKFCVPNTGCGTLKQTWKDSGQLVLNTNPVVLDSAGRATIFGNGSYEMQVYDSSGQLIWGGQTSAVAGTLLTNTSAMSVLANPASGSGPPSSVPIQAPLAFLNGKLGVSATLIKDTSNQTVQSNFAYTTRVAGGTNPLIYTVINSSNFNSGFSFTIIANIAVSVQFDAADTVTNNSNPVQLVNGQVLVATTDGAGKWYIQVQRQVSSPQLFPGQVLKFRGTTCPAGTLLEDGSAVSRTTYAALFAYQGTAYGVGDGSTTFNLANSGGQFDRNWVSGQTVDAGRAFGSTQLDALQQHTHTYVRSNNQNGALYSNGNSINPNVGTATVNSGGATGRVDSETRPTNLTQISCVATGNLQ